MIYRLSRAEKSFFWSRACGGVYARVIVPSIVSAKFELIYLIKEAVVN